ncbi:uncharacterized protein LOC134679159 [Cydia fagiglandana]|uniref:uncharacterized protein LOC134679159 n=1 Tax=Cydia fagiglandana TaxID=1458189 RepID=UPI002FEE1DB6
MARTKITRRTYNLKQQQTENISRTAESSLPEEPPQELSTSEPQECPLIQAKTPEVPPAPAAPTETLPTTEALEPEKETLSKFNTSTIECQEDTSTINVQESVAVVEASAAITSKLQENTVDMNDDSLELEGTGNNLVVTSGKNPEMS